MQAALAAPGRKTAALRYYRALAQPWYRSREYAAEQAALFKLPSCPVLFLQGADDGCFSPAFAARALAALPPHSVAELVSDAGHFLELEQPEYVGEPILSFTKPRPLTPSTPPA